MDAKWHFYDQGFFYHLGKDPSSDKAELFMESLGDELGIDLFADYPGFKIANTPFSFLEAIGLTSFPNASNEITPAVLADFEILLPEIHDGSKSITELPMIVMKHYQHHFRKRSELSTVALITQAERQIKNIPNPVLAKLIEQIIQFPINELKNPLRSENYRRAICDFLSLDFTQQFPFYDFLSSSYPNNAQRRTKTQEIYHAFFQMAEDAIKTQRNISYFRSFDRARNTFAIQADGIPRQTKQKFVDPYRSTKANLENNKDGLDVYLIHFAICGFFFSGKNHSTLIFTLDSPNVIRNRIIYGLQMLNWINDCKGRSFKLNPGVVYCFDQTNLNIIDKIEVAKIEYTPILCK